MSETAGGSTGSGGLKKAGTSGAQDNNGVTKLGKPKNF